MENAPDPQAPFDKSGKQKRGRSEDLEVLPLEACKSRRHRRG